MRWATADADLAAALAEHGELIAGEVLAVSFGPGAGPRACTAGSRGATRRGRAWPGRGTSTPTPTWGCASGWPWRRLTAGLG